MNPLALQSPSTLAERFWSLAKSRPRRTTGAPPDPVEVVRSVLEILDALETGAQGEGLSQATISFLTLLRQEELAGDLSYCSPEQARGETIDERSLVFSVGVLLFEELTGRHPFGAQPSGRRVARIQKGELGSGVQFFPQLPAALRSMLVKAMGPFPEERYRSLAELRAELERFTRGEAPERPAPPPVSLRGLPGDARELMLIAAQGLDVGDDNAKTTVRRRPQRSSPAAPGSSSSPSSRSSSSSPAAGSSSSSSSRRRALALAQAGSVAGDATTPFVRQPKSAKVVSLLAPSAAGADEGDQGEQDDADEVSLRRRPRAPGWAVRALERLAFVGIGAAVAVAAVAIGQRSTGSTPAAAVAAPPAVAAPAAPSLREPSAVAAAASATASASLGAPAAPTLVDGVALGVEGAIAALAAPPAPQAVAAAPSAAVAPSPAESEKALDGNFDPAVAGKSAAEKARGCFEPLTKSVSFGAGLLFAPGAATARRLFLSPSEPLSPDERRCVSEALLGATAGGPPPRRTIVEVRLRLRPDAARDEVRATLAP
jgi:hypothetical protein